MECCNVRRAEQLHRLTDLFERPVPPGHLKQHFNFFVRKPFSNRLRWVAADDRIGLNILRYEGATSDDGTMTNLDTRHDHRFGTDPDIAADNRVAGGFECIASVSKRRLFL